MKVITLISNRQFFQLDGKTTAKGFETEVNFLSLRIRNTTSEARSMKNKIENASE